MYDMMIYHVGVDDDAGCADFVRQKMMMIRRKNDFVADEKNQLVPNLWGRFKISNFTS